MDRHCDGFSQHLIEYKNKNGESVFALPFETDEKIFLIRMSFKRAIQIIKDDSGYDVEDDEF